MPVNNSSSYLRRGDWAEYSVLLEVIGTLPTMDWVGSDYKIE